MKSSIGLVFLSLGAALGLPEPIDLDALDAGYHALNIAPSYQAELQPDDSSRQQDGYRSFFGGPKSALEEQPNEEVPYEVIPRSPPLDGYELREYNTTNWVCTEEVHSPHGPQDNNAMFRRLFRYISGGNKEEVHVAMTAPVLTKITPTPTPTRSLLHKQMCLYLPAIHQEYPPTPVDPEVVIETTPVTRFYVRQVGGYIKDDREWIAEAGRFADMIAKSTEEVYRGFFMGASFDSPMKLWNRRNEIWYKFIGEGEWAADVEATTLGLTNVA